MTVYKKLQAARLQLGGKRPGCRRGGKAAEAGRLAGCWPEAGWIVVTLATCICSRRPAHAGHIYAAAGAAFSPPAPVGGQGTPTTSRPAERADRCRLGGRRPTPGLLIRARLSMYISL